MHTKTVSHETVYMANSAVTMEPAMTVIISQAFTAKRLSSVSSADAKFW